MSDDEKTWIGVAAIAVVLFLLALSGGSDGGGPCGNAVGEALEDCADHYEERFLNGR